MTFPVTFTILGHPILPHQLFESAAYLVGFQTYLALRQPDPPIPDPHLPVPPPPRPWITPAAMPAPLPGSNLPASAESPHDSWSARHNPAIWLGGKTIVGGLLGGWLAVELAKRRMRLHTTTG